jgi:hypothetical protein
MRRQTASTPLPQNKTTPLMVTESQPTAAQSRVEHAVLFTNGLAEVPSGDQPLS